MSPLRYEAVDSAPLDAIISLYRAGGWWQESEQARETLPRLIRGSFCFMVARDADRYVGMARAISDGVSDAYIQDVVVLPEYRRKGVGAALVSKVVDYCRERRLEWIGLVAQPGTTHFYEGLGFGVLEGHVALRLK